MTLFEYISVAVSLVLSFAAVRLLSGLSVALLPDRRFWVHVSWLVWTLLASALVWWNFWGYRGAEWNFFSFLLILTFPGAIYLMSAALVPESPSHITSWEAYFFSARRRFFFGLAAFFASVALAAWVLIDDQLVTPPRVTQTMGFAMALAGAFSDNPRLHKVLPVCFALLFAAATVAIFFQPGALAPHP